MRISDLVNKRIGLLGLGREGSATLDVLRRRGHHAPVLAFADMPGPVPDGVTLSTTPRDMAALEVIIRSPGFAPASALRRAADASGTRQVTATQLFLREMRDNRLTVIGITASKGKSTTSKLTELTLREAGLDAVLVGNIGVPALGMTDEILKRRAIAVMELSSYQCADIEAGYAPDIAMLGALFPEHLDYHGGAEAYYRAKTMIATQQRPGDILFCHYRSAGVLDGLPCPGERRLMHAGDGLHYADGYFFRGGEILFPGSEMRLLGDHNRENAVASLSVAELFGATPDHLRAVIAGFSGLPYRLQEEGVHGGIRWINDSISTAPEAAAVALNAVGEQAQTLIAGGFDRGYDMAPLVAAILASALEHVILMPMTGGPIAEGLRQRRARINIHEVADLAEAVRIAGRVTGTGRTCVFSPGAPSYTFFRDFEERGAAFRRKIRESGPE